MLVIFVPRLWCTLRFPAGRKTPVHRKHRRHALLDRYVTRCCPPGIASLRLFISFDARNQAFQFRSNMHHRERGDFICRAGNDFAFLTNIFVYVRLPTFVGIVKSRDEIGRLISFFFFLFFLLIFYDNKGSGNARVQRPIFTRDSRFPRLITRTK